MYFRENSNGEVSGHISKHVNFINVFHDGSSALSRRLGFYCTKVINDFNSENLALFTKTSTNSTRKIQLTEILKQYGKQHKILGCTKLRQN